MDEQLDVLKYVSENMGDRDLEMQFSTGEIMVHPNRDKIIEMLQGYRTLLFTNATIYSEKLASLMEQGLLTIMTSIDCGTPETFRRIKSVDCFDKVCCNLARYAATGGCVVLNYIMLPGINDTEAEADGFVDLAAKLGAVVQLSNDTRTKRVPLPEGALGTACRIASRAKENNLLVIHETDVFSESDNEAISDALSMNAGPLGARSERRRTEGPGGWGVRGGEARRRGGAGGFPPRKSIWSWCEGRGPGEPEGAAATEGPRVRGVPGRSCLKCATPGKD
jgi:hypothetical protein